MPNMVDPQLLKEVLLDEATLQARVAELGAQISRDYADSAGLVLICILKGGVVFLTDIMRHITVPHQIDFMAASSYGVGQRESTHTIRLDMDITTPINDKDVLIIEDIIDTGLTLRYVLDTLLLRKPRSLRLCALLNKASRREVEIPLTYVGFEIDNKFVFGYGLDLDEQYRNLPFIGVVNEDKLHHE